jgi:hypothetical protein
MRVRVRVPEFADHERARSQNHRLGSAWFG